jgi:hypothetical protein
MSFSAHKTVYIAAGVAVAVVALIAGSYLFVALNAFPHDSAVSSDESQDAGLSGEEKLKVIQDTAPATGLSGEDKLKLLER